VEFTRRELSSRQHVACVAGVVVRCTTIDRFDDDVDAGIDGRSDGSVDRAVYDCGIGRRTGW
jgi:hypothetical protein